MSEHVDIDKQVRVYFLVFGALMVCTLITVGAAALDVSMPVAITIGLFIASIKASLVACFFMHLIDEKRVIYLALGLTVALFVVLLALPILTSFTDQVGDFERVEAPAPH